MRKEEAEGVEGGGEQAVGWIGSPELHFGMRRFHVSTHEGVVTLLQRVAGDSDRNAQPQHEKPRQQEKTPLVDGAEY